MGVTTKKKPECTGTVQNKGSWNIYGLCVINSVYVMVYVGKRREKDWYLAMVQSIKGEGCI